MAQSKTAVSPLLMHWRYCSLALTHWGRVTHICVSKLPSIGSDNGLSPGRRQAIIWTNAGILLIGALGTNVSEILVKIVHFHWRKCFWKCRLEKGGHLVSASMCWAIDLTSRWTEAQGSAFCVLAKVHSQSGNTVMALCKTVVSAVC